MLSVRLIVASLFASLVVPGADSLTAQPPEIAQLGDCVLGSGGVIRDCRLAYRTLGRLNPERTNAVLFPTWYTGTSESIISLIRSSGLVDTSGYFVIVVDALGNGISSSPSNTSGAFPEIRIRDMVDTQYRLLTQHLDIQSLHAVIGFSMGGMQAFEWAVAYPEFAKRVIPIAGSPKLAAYDIVLWQTELRLLELLAACSCQAPASAFWGIEFLLLRTPEYHARETPRDSARPILARIDQDTVPAGRALDWASQARAMVNHNVAARFDDSLERAAAAVRAEVMVIVGLSDHMVTPGPALKFARLLKAEILGLTTDCGHVFLWCKRGEVAAAVRSFLDKSDQ